MKWTDIKIIADRKYRRVFDYVSREVCPSGFAIEDYSDIENSVSAKDKEDIEDLIDEKLLKKDKNKITVHHYISPEQNREDARHYLESRLDREGVKYTVQIEYIEQKDWEEGWKKYYHTINIGERLAICPAWEEYKGDRIAVKLDPGLAFGTGEHDTTRLCLEELDKIIHGGERVLDVGCGSGILAISALLLGAKVADGVDIDPMAVKSATENRVLNHVEDKFNIFVGDLAEKATGQYDIILANIVAGAIMELSVQIPPILKKGGIYITGGIIDTRKDEVAQRLKSLGFTLLRVKESRGWVCFVCTI
jgi:ribosomal protein L11 methyltransferase